MEVHYKPSHFLGDNKVITGTVDEIIPQLPEDIAMYPEEMKKESTLYRAQNASPSGTPDSFGKVKRKGIFRKKEAKNVENQTN